MTIVVFDSGVGGLSVLREARMLLHDHHFVYVGDDAGFPYGGWDGEALTQRIATLFDTLVEKYQPSLAIIACNTASTLIMPSLRDKFPIPFVGIVPAIKPAAEKTASGLISVLATPGTVQRPIIQELISEHAEAVQVNLVGATKLAQLSEEHMQGRGIDTDVLLSEITPCFIEQDGSRTDIVTLGCTHYPFLVNEMRKLAPWPVDWLDPAEAVARQAARELKRTAELIELDRPSVEIDRDIAIMTSNEPTLATTRLLKGIGLQVESVEL